MGLWNFSTTQLLCIKGQKKVLKFEKCEYIEYLRKLGLIVSKNLLLQEHIKNKQNWTTAENFDICLAQNLNAIIKNVLQNVTLDTVPTDFWEFLKIS